MQEDRIGDRRTSTARDFNPHQRTLPLISGALPIGASCKEPEVKTTEYFKYMRKRPDRATIQDEWMRRVAEFPQKTEVQSDGRIRKWGWITEEGKFLRVVLLEDGETVHNAFFDRSFKENRQ